MKFDGIYAPDLAAFIEDKPGEGFIEWCEATAQKMAEASTPEERAYARLLRAMMVATIESARTAELKGEVAPEVIVRFVPRAAMTATIAALASCFKEDTPTAFIRQLATEELDFILSYFCPGETIGAGK